MNKLKLVVGLLALVCALAGLTTSAFAEFRHVGTEAQTLKGGETTLVATGSGGSASVKCVKLTGTGKAQTTQGSATKPSSGETKQSTIFDATITFEECTGPFGFPATVETTKCQFEFHQALGSLVLKSSLRPSSAKESCTARIKVPASGCELTFVPTGNENLEGLEGSALKTNPVSVKGTVKGIKVVEVGGFCGVGSAATATLQLVKPVTISNEELI